MPPPQFPQAPAAPGAAMEPANPANSGAAQQAEISPRTAPAASSANSRKEKSKGKSKDFEKVVGPVSLTTVLEPTPYKDANDRGKRRLDGTFEAKSDDYRRAQIEILIWLRSHAAEDLRPSKARWFTEKIAGGCPSVTEAVSLCYYMREQGFDTYAKLLPQENAVKLFVANNQVVNRNPPSGNVDWLYWHQNLKTGAILSVNTTQPDAHQVLTRSRRGAIVDDMLGTQTRSLMSLRGEPRDDVDLGPDLIEPTPSEADRIGDALDNLMRQMGHTFPTGDATRTGASQLALARERNEVREREREYQEDLEDLYDIALRGNTS